MKMLKRILFSFAFILLKTKEAFENFKRYLWIMIAPGCNKQYWMKNIAKAKGCANFVFTQTWRQMYSFRSQQHLDTNWKWAKVLHSLPWRNLHSQRMVHLTMFSKIQSRISFTFVTSWQWKRLIAEILIQRKQQMQINFFASFNFHLVCCCWSSLL